ncbi:MAG: hypothetical protein AAFM91_02655 [Pseudomonadota bacterium]
MNKTVTALLSAGLLFAAGSSSAEHHEGVQLDPAAPIELYACNFNEGKGPADYDKAIGQWNKWADRQKMSSYSAWTLTPYYAGAEQDFDVIWLGATEKMKDMGRAHDMYLAKGESVQKAFADVIDCDTHAMFAAIQFKEPPEREDPSSVVITFSDCSGINGSSFDDLVPSMAEWAKYSEANGSTAGMWALMPALGGGGEEFEFKWVSSFQNLEEMGSHQDHYAEEGWKKGNELFKGKVECDSSRVYIATNRRMADES